MSSALWASSNFCRLWSAVALPSAEMVSAVLELLGSVISAGVVFGALCSSASWLRVDENTAFGSWLSGAARFRVDVRTSTEASLAESSVRSVRASSYAHIVRNYLRCVWDCGLFQEFWS